MLINCQMGLSLAFYGLVTVTSDFDNQILILPSVYTMLVTQNFVVVESWRNFHFHSFDACVPLEHEAFEILGSMYSSVHC